ncbi:hypothetical protein AYL99_07723 [Fonsecaea erecta]|uniref:Uncharacterized protein n=1 Tax=Fonsecaea erecta TaxID=1367422 RepID=A0A178ZHG9_9EURO|nr:hypothetical protein AYL99_07723 [Fonsecaea erecta]OAP58633.1 hypothetical protein AYL99_07723 [Fonsecaea erecta]
MNPSTSQEKVVGAKTLESQVHKTSEESQKRPASPSNSEQYPRAAKKPKQSRAMSPEPAEYIVSSSRASTATTVTIGRIWHDSTQGSLPYRERTDNPHQSGSSRDSFDQAPKATFVTTQEEEGDHPHNVVWNGDFADGVEHVINQHWDLAHVGSFVDDEATTEGLRETPDDVPDTVGAS